MIQNHLIYYDEVVPNVKEIYEAITMEEVKNVIKKINTKEMAVIFQTRKICGRKETPALPIHN